MLENTTAIRLELGIAAQKMSQQIIVHNEHIEAEISKGIQMAMEEVLSDNNFALKVKEQTLTTIEGIVNKAIFSWDLQQKIFNAVQEKIGLKIQDYADKIAEKVAAELK